MCPSCYLVFDMLASTYAILLCWSLRQFTFIMAYMQALIEMDMYMELPMGIETKHGNSKSHVLKLLSNLNGQKQAGHLWNQYLVNKLFAVCFTQLLVDECVFYCNDVIFIVYVDDRLFLGPSECKLTVMIKALKQSGLKIEDQGHPSNYIGVNRRNIMTVLMNFHNWHSLTQS